LSFFADRTEIELRVKLLNAYPEFDVGSGDKLKFPPHLFTDLHSKAAVVKANDEGVGDEVIGFLWRFHGAAPRWTVRRFMQT
jgi:hypothetical protein